VANTGRVLDCQGLPQAPVGRLTLRDCRLDQVREASIVRRITDLQLDGVRVNGTPVSRL
jgi:hypothetical protein